jgi:small subunit ribosomal protein S16
MVRIRLRRVGSKGQPSYRIIAADKESPRDGRFLEILGFYNPRTSPATVNLHEDRIYDWMSKGALPTESVGKIFQSAGVMARFERFKQGEPLETLLKEAINPPIAQSENAKTSQAKPVKKTKKAKSEE